MKILLRAMWGKLASEIRNIVVARFILTTTMIFNQQLLKETHKICFIKFYAMLRLVLLLSALLHLAAAI